VRKLDKNNNRSKEAVGQEKHALSLLYSDYISKMYEFYEDNLQFYFILEYIPGKNLMSIIKENIFMSL
jgi:serine/threonine protein kinase